MSSVYIRFPEGKAKCLTFSYDDGNQADIRLVELFNKYNVKATFNLNSGAMPQVDGKWRLPKQVVGSLYEGHEIACHGLDHLLLTTTPLPYMTYQVLENRKELEKLSGRIVRGYAYPFGKPDELDDDITTSLRAGGIQYARTGGKTLKFDLPQDWYNWHPTCKHTHEKLMELADAFLNTNPDEFEHKKSPYLFYIYGHSFEFDNDDNWDVMEEFLKKVSSRNDVWYATNGEIYNYVIAFRSLSFNAEQTMVYNPSCHKLYFTFDSKYYTINPGETITLDS